MDCNSAKLVLLSHGGFLQLVLDTQFAKDIKSLECSGIIPIAFSGGEVVRYYKAGWIPASGETKKALEAIVHLHLLRFPRIGFFAFLVEAE